MPDSVINPTEGTPCETPNVKATPPCRNRYYKHIHVDAVRSIAREEGKQLSEEFLELFDHFVAKKVRQACAVHNGGKKRVDATIAGFVGIK